MRPRQKRLGKAPRPRRRKSNASKAQEGASQQEVRRRDHVQGQQGQDTSTRVVARHQAWQRLLRQDGKPEENAKGKSAAQGLGMLRQTECKEVDGHTGEHRSIC